MDWQIGDGLADWQLIGNGLAMELRIGGLAIDWRIGNRLADWQSIGGMLMDW